MSTQTFVITPKNYPRPLEVFGEHAAVLASGAGEVSSELFLKEGSRGSASPLHRRRSERAPTKTFSTMMHRMRGDVRSWSGVHGSKDATKVVGGGALVVV